MRTSAAGRAAITRHEGVVLSAYRDPVGVWTIGIGHTAMAGEPKPIPGMKITREEADMILSRDLHQFEDAVERLVKVPLNQNEFDALVSFTFNLGAGALGGSTLLKKLNAGDRAGAANEFRKWVNAGGKKLPGLVTRREDERRVFLTPVAGAPPLSPPDVEPIPTPPKQVPAAASGAPILVIIAIAVVAAAVFFFVVRS